MRFRLDNLSFLGNLLTHFSGRVFFVMAKFLAISLLARGLGPSQFGIYVLLTFTIILVSSLGLLGMMQSCTFHFSRDKHCSELVGLCLLQATGLGGGLVLCTYGVMFFCPNLFSHPSRLVQILTLANIPFFLFGYLLDGIFAGKKHFFTLAFRNSLRWTLNLIILGILYLWSFINLETALACNLFTNILVMTLFLLLIIKEHSPCLPNNISIVKECYFYGFKMYFLDMMFLLILRFDYYFAKYFDNLVNLGYYALVTNINEVFLQLPNSLYNVILPSVADSDKEVAKITSFSCRVLFSLSILWYVILLVAGPLIINILGGGDYSSAYKVLIIQFPFVSFMCIYLIIAGYISGMNLPNLLTKATSITLVILVAMNLILTPRYGIYGAACAKVLTGIFLVCSTYLMVRKATNWQFRDIILLKKNDLQKIKEKIIGILGLVDRAKVAVRS